jgi:hypothetical protein
MVKKIKVVIYLILLVIKKCYCFLESRLQASRVLKNSLAFDAADLVCINCRIGHVWVDLWSLVEYTIELMFSI